VHIYLMTDLEGVSGVLNVPDWCNPDSRYYELAKELLTQEVNAAVEGFFAGGATAITVSDGHGAGGIRFPLLHSRVRYLRGYPTGWPLMLEQGYDAVAWVGQHAKAGTEFAHLAHTQGFSYLDLSVNGVSIGELGQCAFCAGELGIRSIFLAGDRAACREARELIPGIETVEVKQGTTPGRGDECTAEQYMIRNQGAIHLHPEVVHKALREGAERAVRRAKREDFGLAKLAPPYELVARFRPIADRPASIATASHPSSFSALMNLKWDIKNLP
jgi:D-amino peptidase